jgi:hypothetical protein
MSENVIKFNKYILPTKQTNPYKYKHTKYTIIYIINKIGDFRACDMRCKIHNQLLLHFESASGLMVVVVVVSGGIKNNKERGRVSFVRVDSFGTGDGRAGIIQQVLGITRHNTYTKF